MRDSQRSKLYRAEKAAFECFDREPEMTLADCQKLVDRAMRFFREISSPRVSDGRGRRTAWASLWEIRLPRWSRRRMWVLHEVAHTISRRLARRKRRPIQGHGKEFARTYMKLVRRFIGRAEADLLKLSFSQHRVKHVVRETSKEKGAAK